jgi:hypothetical protein
VRRPKERKTKQRAGKVPASSIAHNNDLDGRNFHFLFFVPSFSRSQATKRKKVSSLVCNGSLSGVDERSDAVLLFTLLFRFANQNNKKSPQLFLFTPNQKHLDLDVCLCVVVVVFFFFSTHPLFS